MIQLTLSAMLQNPQPSEITHARLIKGRASMKQEPKEVTAKRPKWTPEMEEQFSTLYPETDNRILMPLFGLRSLSSVRVQAKRLGVKKTAAYLQAMSRRAMMAAAKIANERKRGK